jgi:hypothetical protein
MTEKVLCSLISWRRPNNIPAVIAALRRQTVPVHIAIVECAPRTEFALPPATLDLADIVFSIDHNIGPISRLIPPLMLSHEFEYVFFAVDDHVPGPQCIAWMLDTARMLGDQHFCTIGQDGRWIRDGEIVKRKGRMQPNHTTPIDVITSSELCRTKHLRHVLGVRDQMADQFGSEFPWIEDDLILCLGLQMYLRRKLDRPVPCYLTPEPPNELASWQYSKLHAPHALCARPNHAIDRNKFVQQISSLGWSSAVPWAMERQA